MKTLIFLCSVFCPLFLSHAASAQIQKGSFRIGGTASYSNFTYENDYAFNQLTISPSVAYFVIDRLSLGMTVPISFSSGSSSSYNYSTSSYRIGPDVRYYFPFGDWAIFPELSYSFGKTVSDSDFQDGMGDPLSSRSEVKYRSFTPGFGITYFINRNVGIEGITRYTFNNESVVNPFSMVEDKVLTFSIGFQIYLNRE